MVETALVLPLLLVLIFAALDVDRFFYARAQVVAAANAAGRALIVDPLRSDDCAVLSRAQGLAPGLNLQLDPKSDASPPGTDPRVNPPQAWTTPPGNGAYLYIYPAALATGTCSTTRSAIERPTTPSTVSALVSYGWIPETPLLGLLPILVQAVDTEYAQY